MKNAQEATSANSSAESDGVEWLDETTSAEWDEPAPEVMTWLQAQGGLKIARSPIKDRDGLEKAFRLLHGWEENLPFGSYDYCALGDLALAVGALYVRRVCGLRGSEEVKVGHVYSQRRSGTVDALIQPGLCGQIMERKCSVCHSVVLNDAFPQFARKSPKHYVVRTLEGRGCGLPHCRGRVQLAPLDDTQPSIRAVKKDLENPPDFRGRKPRNEVFYRSGAEELEGLAPIVKVKCKGCGHIQEDTTPRFTRGKPARYCIPRRTCQKPDGCGKKDQYLNPVDKIPHIGQSNLTDMCTNFENEGIDVRKLLVRIPSAYEVVFELHRPIYERAKDLKRLLEDFENSV